MERVRAENITIGEAVTVFGIGRTTLYDLMKRGEIEAFKLGRRTLIKTESVCALIDRLPRIGAGV